MKFIKGLLVVICLLCLNVFILFMLSYTHIIDLDLSTLPLIGQFLDQREEYLRDVDKYTFDTEIYPYYALLTEDEKVVYTEAYICALHYEETFRVTNDLNNESLNMAMEALYNDHPEFYYLETNYTYKYNNQNEVQSVTLAFNRTNEDIISSKVKFDSEVERIVSYAMQEETNLKKEKYVHNYLVDHVTYDESNDQSQSAYSAIVEGKSVCAGYTRAFQYIMQKLDIPTYYCTGSANNELHAWNIVKLNGDYYNVDVLWDDQYSEVYHKYSYRYFNVSDSGMSDHIRDGLSVSLFKCTNRMYE